MTSKAPKVGEWTGVGMRTGIRCPHCLMNEVVYNGNYFCEWHGPGQCDFAYANPWDNPKGFRTQENLTFVREAWRAGILRDNFTRQQLRRAGIDLDTEEQPPDPTGRREVNDDDV